jgi:hypothetical protein
VSLAQHLEDAAKEGEYEVRWTLVVDHPEKRDESYPKVKPGTRLGQSKSYPTQKQAVAYAKELVAGDFDFASEYPTNVTVIQRFQGRSPRTVMKPVSRERTADGTVVVR